MVEKYIKFNEIGQEMVIKAQLKYEDLRVFELPACCSKCPVSFSTKAKCGRNIPFKEEDYERRPKTCKLEKITLADLITI